jgi:metal-sulfur cluster biosynthetic enzyme
MSSEATGETLTREQVIQVLQTVYDPEIPVNIWDLGLVYDVALAGNDVAIRMTLTALGCPIGPTIAREIENRLQAVGAGQVRVDFVWSPPWTPARLTPEGRETLRALGYPV